MNNFVQQRPTNIFARFWHFLTDPHPSIRDVAEGRRVQLIAGLCIILFGALLLGLFSAPSTPTIFLPFITITLLVYALSRTKYYRAGAYFFSFGFTSVAYIMIYLGTARSIDTTISSIVPISLILASAILSQRGFLLLAIFTVGATISVTSYADPKYLSDPNLTLARTIGTTFSTAAILLGITLFRLNVENARLKEVRTINTELEDLTKKLEQRMEERTVELKTANEQTSRRAAQLKAVTELSEAIAELQDLNELFPATTKLISERFGFYHVGIFLVDANREYAILQAANSEGGKRMLARHHRLKLGTGVVGFAAQSEKPRIALDVGVDAVFFNNPDLPETRSEVALPLITGKKTVGILDVQSTEAGAFTEDDLQVLGTLANQVAIALENTRLLTEARAAATQVQEVYNEFVRTEWGRTVTRVKQAGFRYNIGRIELLENPSQDSNVLSAMQSGNLVVNQPNGSETNRSTVAVPVKLRGEVIGILHIESNDPFRSWQENELSLMEAVAERAALAMENARLFQDARRRAAKEQLISEATARVSGSLSIENILQTTASELERVLGGSEVLIRFKSKESV